MKLRFDVIVMTILVACALVTTGVVVRREFFNPADAKKTPEYLKDWKALASKGTRIGSANATVQIIEFSDFECPFCAKFHENYTKLKTRLGDKVALTFVHYPLPMHKSAIPAAKAAECAGEQGRFEQMHDALFKSQQELGTKKWGSFAIKAGVPDQVKFDACMNRPQDPAKITQGLALAKQLNVSGTPSVIVNGWNIGTTGPEELDRVITEVLAGKKPF